MLRASDRGGPDGTLMAFASHAKMWRAHRFNGRGAVATTMLQGCSLNQSLITSDAHSLACPTL